MAQQRYQVIERIDAGGMAEVFKASSTSLQGYQKLVAIKRVLPELTQNERFVRMFLDEAKVSLHLNHTNIVQVFDLAIADGTYFIVMEYVDGTNLKKIIQLLGRRKQRLSIELAVHIALQVCQGLAHAHVLRDQRGHHLGIVHRDISPPNVLISREGEVKITDFGLAKAKNQAEVTDPGVVKGKFGYLSPEAATGEDVDARTDIFAVGILLWEMIAGRRLFLGETDYDTLKQVQKAEIPALAQFGVHAPAQLEQILARTLTRDPRQRFQTARELGLALAEFLFSYGRVVSAFDLARLVDSVLEKKDERKAAADVAAGQQVQRELNQLVSIDQMGNLDLYLAEHYGAMASDGDARGPHDGSGEDPREWMDLGFGGEDFQPVGDAAVHTPIPPGSGDSWQAGGLQDVARATQAMQAIRVETAPRPVAPAAHPQPGRAPGFAHPEPHQAAETAARPEFASAASHLTLPPSHAPQTPSPLRPTALTPPPAQSPAQPPMDFNALAPPTPQVTSKEGGRGPLLLVAGLVVIILIALAVIVFVLDLV